MELEDRILGPNDLDLVCGTRIEETLSRHEGLVSEFHGREYFFCSRECQRRFESDPGAFTITISEQEAPDGLTNEGYAG